MNEHLLRKRLDVMWMSTFERRKRLDVMWMSTFRSEDG